MWLNEKKFASYEEYYNETMYAKEAQRDVVYLS
jgi:hypothetical protein